MNKLKNRRIILLTAIFLISIILFIIPFGKSSVKATDVEIKDKYTVTDKMFIGKNDLGSSNLASDGNPGYYRNSLSNPAADGGGNFINDGGYQYRYCDNDYYSVYEFPAYYNRVETFVKLWIHGGYQISISTNADEENPVWEVLKSQTPGIPLDKNNPNIESIDISEYLDTEKVIKSIFIKVGDATPADGGGGCLNSIVIEYNIPFDKELKNDPSLQINKTLEYMQVGRNDTGDQGYIKPDLGHQSGTDEWGPADVGNPNYIYRYYDVDDYVVIAFNINSKSVRTFFEFFIHSDFYISVSVEPKKSDSWKEIISRKTRCQVDTENPNFSWDATDYIEENKTADTIYFKIGDSIKPGGNGGAIHRINMYTYEVRQDPTFKFGDTMMYEIDIKNEDLIYHKNGNIGFSNTPIHRWADTDASFSYRFIFPQGSTDAFMWLRCGGNNRNIEISVNDGDFQELSYVGINNDDPKWNSDRVVDFDTGVQAFSLKKYLIENSDTTMEIRFSAKDKTCGNGTDLYYLTVYCNRSFYADNNDPINAVSTIHKIEPTDFEHFMEESTCSNDNIVYPDNLSRYFDSGKYGIYRFDLENSDNTALELTLNMCSGFIISVSNNMEDWVDIDIATLKYVWEVSDIDNLKDYSYDVSFLLGENVNKIYVKLGDITSQGGWGAWLKYMFLREIAVKENNDYSIIDKNKLLNYANLSDDKAFVENKNTEKIGPFRKITDSNSYFTYKLDFNSNVNSLSLAMLLTGKMDIYYSVDGTNYKIVDKEKYVEGSDYLQGTSFTVDLSYILENNTEVWLRFSGKDDIANNVCIIKEIIIMNNYSNIGSQDKTEYQNKKVQYCIANDSLDENQYLISNKDMLGIGTSWDGRFFDRCSYGIYKFGFDNNAKHLTLVGVIGGSYLLEVSTDKINWNQKLICDIQNVPNTKGIKKDLYLNIDDLIENNTNKEIYVRISDTVKDNGWGASISGLGLISYSGDKIIENNDKPSSTGCNSSIAGNILYSLLIISFSSWVILKKKVTR